MVNALQHIGIGVSDIGRSYHFYRSCLGFGIKMSEIEYDVWELEPMFGRRPRMHIHNSFNPNGGPSLELFQHIDTPPRQRKNGTSWDDIGFLELGIQVEGLTKLYTDLADKGITFLSDIKECDIGTDVWRYCYLKDPDDQLIQLVEIIENNSSTKSKKKICGINHVGIGVSGIDRAAAFYGEVLGFNKQISRRTYNEAEMDDVMPRHGDLEIAVFTRRKGSTAKISAFKGGMIKLIQTRNISRRHVFSNRRFGDPGLTEIGLDVDDITTVYHQALETGAQSLVPPTKFDWGFGPCGTLAYVMDLDGNVVEFVELKRIFFLSPSIFDQLIFRPMKMISKYINL